MSEPDFAAVDMHVEDIRQSPSYGLYAATPPLRRKPPLPIIHMLRRPLI